MNHSTPPDADAAASAASASLKATLAGGAALFAGGLTADKIAMLGGLLIGLAGLALQWYYQRRRDRREEAEHEVRMLAMLDGEGAADER